MTWCGPGSQSSYFSGLGATKLSHLKLRGGPLTSHKNILGGGFGTIFLWLKNFELQAFVAPTAHCTVAGEAGEQCAHQHAYHDCWRHGPSVRR